MTESVTTLRFLSGVAAVFVLGVAYVLWLSVASVTARGWGLTKSAYATLATATPAAGDHTD